MRAGGWKALKFYLAPGVLIGAIKLVSAATWFLYHAAIGDGFVDTATIFGLGLASTAISIFAWPVVVYNVLIGTVPFSAALFFPWVTTL